MAQHEVDSKRQMSQTRQKKLLLPLSFGWCQAAGVRAASFTHNLLMWILASFGNNLIIHS